MHLANSQNVLILEKAAIGTPKGTKKLDNSLSSSPSLRKTDNVKPKVMFTGVTDEQCEKVSILYREFILIKKWDQT